MSSNLNKPTGLGYQSPMQRLCVCGHVEAKHYGHRCYAEDCVRCEGFSTREREATARQVQHEWEYVDEAIYRELKDEVRKRGD